jgi:alpha-tubulin suppressor-like RCC1 family protein
MITLGYAEETIQWTPKEVQTLKKICILGAAASKFHTVVYSSQGHVYTWGENMGQLGYKQALHCIQPTPKKVVILNQQTILQVAATNDATAVLTGSYDVHVFSLFLVQKVVFPHQSAGRSLKETRVDIHKITSGKNQFAAISRSGDVYMWVPPIDIKYADAWQMDVLPQKHPRKVWSVRKRFLTARDVAIGIDSSLLVCTESGHVFHGVR